MKYSNLFQPHVFFWKDKGLLVKNKSMRDLWDLVNQVSVFINFVRLNKSQNWSSLLNQNP